MQRITQTDLDTLLDRHEQWLTSKQGEPLVLRDVDARSLSLAKRRLTRLQFVNVKLDGADLRNVLFAKARLQQVSMVGANLVEADFESAYLEQLDAQRAHFDDASLSSAICKFCNFMHAEMPHTNLIKASFFSCVFDHAVLTDTRCNRITISRSSLRHVQLQRAYMSFISLYDADLRGVNVSQVQLIKPKIFENLAVYGLQTQGVILEDGHFGGWYDSSPSADRSQLHDGAWMQQVLRGEIDVS